MAAAAAPTGEVVARFVLTSLLMWLLPVALLLAVNSHLIPGTAGLSSASTTLFGGLLAVLALNAVVCAYVLMALWDKPAGGLPKPDAAFAASARRSLLATSPAPAAGVAAEDAKKRE
eukprot:SM000005S17256  [mRNA]  locus=s5:1067601:1068329:- [translate_table: standard]